MKPDLTEKLSAVARLRVDEPLKNHTTFRIGGPARFFIEAATADELQTLHALCVAERLPFLVLGGGSNILFPDHGFDGVVIRLGGDLARVSFSGETVHAGAGVRLPGLVHAASERGLSGLECLAGIPGTVGGALISNAGTKAGWIGDSITCVEVLSPAGRITKINRKDITFSYRASDLEGKVVVAAELCLKKEEKNGILNKISELMLRRSRTQPVNTWNAGSIFKNPEGDSAGRLIEACGLKGLMFGGAQISDKHANFIINTGKATASDVRSLIATARRSVKEKFGIELALEIKIIGE